MITKHLLHIDQEVEVFGWASKCTPDYKPIYHSEWFDKEKGIIEQLDKFTREVFLRIKGDIFVVRYHQCKPIEQLLLRTILTRRLS